MRPSTISFCLLTTMSACLATAPAAETLRIDGSSTVYPIAAAVIQRMPADQRPEVVFSGSTAGLRKLLEGSVLVANSSRPIKDKELKQATEKGLQIIEVPIAYDGLSVVVNRENRFVDRLTVEELKRIWAPDSSVRTWSELRAGWPETPIALFGPGKDSGTFDYFTEVINGKSGAIRADHVASEDDTVLAEGVMTRPGGTAYFGFAYAQENAQTLRMVPIGPEGRAVEPSLRSIRDGSYVPLSRPLFVYTTVAALERESVRNFLAALLDNVGTVVPQAGYVPLPDEAYPLIRTRLTARSTGSLFVGTHGGDVLAKLKQAAATPAAAPATPVASTPAAAAQPAAAPAAPAPAVVDRNMMMADLQDACLDLSRLSLDERSTVPQLQRQLRLVQLHLERLAAPTATTGR
jgi:phosphate transport system substrate-binding protein